MEEKKELCEISFFYLHEEEEEIYTSLIQEKFDLTLIVENNYKTDEKKDLFTVL